MLDIKMSRYERNTPSFSLVCCALCYINIKNGVKIGFKHFDNDL